MKILHLSTIIRHQAHIEGGDEPGNSSGDRQVDCVRVRRSGRSFDSPKYTKCQFRFCVRTSRSIGRFSRAKIGPR